MRTCQEQRLAPRASVPARLPARVLPGERPRTHPSSTSLRRMHGDWSSVSLGLPSCALSWWRGGASVYDNDNARYCSRVNNSPSLMAIDIRDNNWSREQVRVSRRGRAAGFAKWRGVKSREARPRVSHGAYVYFRSHGGVNNTPSSPVNPINIKMRYIKVSARVHLHARGCAGAKRVIRYAVYARSRNRFVQT